MVSDRVTGAGELKLRLNRYDVDVIRVGLTAEAVEVNETVRHVTLILNKLESTGNGCWCAVAKPFACHGLVTVFSHDGGASHSISAMLCTKNKDIYNKQGFLKVTTLQGWVFTIIM